jgi:stage II sporulation SpoE-like protein/uncharacterized protein DUF4118
MPGGARWKAIATSRATLGLAACVVVDVVVGLTLPDDVPTNIPAGIMLLAVVGATVLSGRIAVGLVGALAAVATLDFFFLPELDSFAVDSSDDAASLVVYAVVLVALVVLVSTFRGTAGRLRSLESELDESVLHVQRALLPGPVPSVSGVDLGRCYRAAKGRHAGGDWYTIVPFVDGRIGLGIGDAEGHGLEAIGAMARSRFSMLAYALDGKSPAEVLQLANRAVVTTAPPPGIFATATYGVIDVARRTWTEACAGHPPTIVRRAGGDTEVVALHPGPPLGVAPNPEYSEAVVQLEELDILALYTDGIIERRDESLEQGIAALRKHLSEADDDLDDQCSRIVDELGNPADDAAMLIARLSVIRAT